MKDIRNDLAKARDKYFESQGEKSCDPSTLGAPIKSRQYLKNRLEAAFIAGWNAAYGQAEYRKPIGDRDEP